MYLKDEVTRLEIEREREREIGKIFYLVVHSQMVLYSKLGQVKVRKNQELHLEPPSDSGTSAITCLSGWTLRCSRKQKQDQDLIHGSLM